jgi:hypothetical protein
LNDQGYALMQQGNFQGARPLLEESVDGLRGTGDIYEAYAHYNLAYTRYQLGECAGILELLDRSQAVQGSHPDIRALRDATFDRCVGGGGDGDDD